MSGLCIIITMIRLSSDDVTHFLNCVLEFMPLWYSKHACLYSVTVCVCVLCCVALGLLVHFH